MLLHVAPPDDSYAATGGSVLGDVYLAAIGLLVCLVVVYLVYKIAMTGRRDYGMPVKRRLLCRRTWQTIIANSGAVGAFASIMTRARKSPSGGLSVRCST
jgi:hypothetical protein